MKKTLIALAALASASVFAQSNVTLGGTYNFGFQKADNGASKADFFDSKVNLSGKEDLGGGLTASFFTEFQLGGRQDITTTQAVSAQTTDSTSTSTTAPVTAGTVPSAAKASGVWARNATVTLAGGFGSVTGGRVESSNYNQKAQLAGASLSDGFDKADLAGAVSNYNIVSYVTPAMNGFTANVAVLKALNSAFAPAAGTASSELKVTAVGVDYAAGPLAAGYVHKAVDTANSTSADGTKNEAYVTYDLGVAKVGYGYGKNSGALYTGQKATNIFSVSMPMGALTVGADYATRSKGGDLTVGNSKGYAVAANYALSKRTKINATIGKLTQDGVAGQSQYRVGLFHNF
ncbi:MAG: hypothetical protein RLZ63_290 [Pseudomonadota bacterium]